jgi:hypothetical protein
MKEKIFRTIFIFGVVSAIGVVGWYLLGNIVRNSDQIVEQTTDSLYVKQYTLYNRDSIVSVYKKPQQFVGVVSKKLKTTQFSIVSGTKETVYTIITYKDKTFETRNRSIYNEYNKGDLVTIEESWYPQHTLKIIKRKWNASETKQENHSMYKGACISYII